MGGGLRLSGALLQFLLLFWLISSSAALALSIASLPRFVFTILAAASNPWSRRTWMVSFNSASLVLT